MADYTQIKLDIADGIATLMLHRPEKMNAFTRVMMDEVIAALDVTDADDSVRAVVFTGAGDRVRPLVARFSDAWERARPLAELRTLGI